MSHTWRVTLISITNLQADHSLGQPALVELMHSPFRNNFSEHAGLVGLSLVSLPQGLITSASDVVVTKEDCLDML